jgi:hypothetical protein
MMCCCKLVAIICPTVPCDLQDDGRYGYLDKPSDPCVIPDGMLKSLDFLIYPEQLVVAVRPFEEDALYPRHFALLGFSEHNQ